MKKALIVGFGGQDGNYLSSHLEKKGYAVIGIGRDRMRVNGKSKAQSVDILKPKEVHACVADYQPREIYYLAAFHHSSQDLKQDDAQLFKKSFDVHVRGLINFLDGINRYAPGTRLFYAASSHIFGYPSVKVQNENTPFNPVCVYGITKTAGLQACRFYRREHGTFASAGILYNHESPLRAGKFVSQKIVQAAIAIKQGKQKELILGDLSAEIDWGFAGDYVDAMHRVLALPAADDFVIASGKTHTVHNFVRGVFSSLGLNWKVYVRENKNLIQKKNIRHLQGDFSKLKAASGWSPKTDFRKLITIMVKAGLEQYGR